MRYLSLKEVLAIHVRVLEHSGGRPGVRDLGSIESAVRQPSVTFDGVDLYPTLVEKAGALGYALVMGHGFIDGNKRVGHAAVEVFLMLNGWELGELELDAHEAFWLQLASGEVARDELVLWLKQHARPA